jgi:hypothetical protein
MQRCQDNAGVRDHYCGNRQDWVSFIFIDKWSWIPALSTIDREWPAIQDADTLRESGFSERRKAVVS